MSGPFSHDSFEDRRSGLEAEYFHWKDTTLIGKLKSVFDTKIQRDELRAATGITNEEVIDRLAALQLRGELLTAFKLFPLVEIAWADGSVDDREAKAIIASAIKSGVPADGPAAQRLKDWIQRGPTAEGRAVWLMYANELKKKLSPAELASFRKELLSYAKSVAEASGGLIGNVFAISPSEERVIEAVAKALT